MKLLTKHGYVKVDKLVDQTVGIVNPSGDITQGTVWCSGKKETVVIRFSNGHEIKSTPDHIFMTIEGNKESATELKGKKLFPDCIVDHNFNNEFIKLGYLQGDGNLGRLDSDTHLGLFVNIGKRDRDILHY